MAHVVDTKLMDRIRRYGAFDVSACFNCGNCTAVCPLSEGSSNFPRRLIRYGQIGMEDRLLADRDLWMCYYCGECSETCPREAEPGEYMASARRYAISRYDVTGLSGLMIRRPAFHAVFFLVLSALVTLLLLWHKGDMNGRQVELFQFIPGPAIHAIGVGILVAIGLAGVLGAWSMIRRFRAVQRGADAHLSLSWHVLAAAAVGAVSESIGQFRYRRCDSEPPADKPLRPKRWLVHGMILWGFLAMLAATSLDYALKPIGSFVEPWSPIRLLGTVGGLVCLAGTAIAIYRRLARSAPGYAHTRLADGFFLGLLATVVMTGLATELVVYLPSPSPVAYLTFLVHVVLAIDVIAMLPLTKFAHALYRPLALFLDRWAELSAARTAAAAEAAG